MDQTQISEIDMNSEHNSQINLKRPVPYHNNNLMLSHGSSSGFNGHPKKLPPMDQSFSSSRMDEDDRQSIQSMSSNNNLFYPRSKSKGLPSTSSQSKINTAKHLEAQK